jgi:hypothetical protein
MFVLGYVVVAVRYCSAVPETTKRLLRRKQNGILVAQFNPVV